MGRKTPERDSCKLMVGTRAFPADCVQVFGKRPQSGKDGLTQRVRELGERSAAPIAPAQHSKHRQPRSAVFKNGSVILPDGARIIVVIKDLSAAGARVEFFARTVLPQEVLLVEPMLKLRRQARVVWQNDGAAGLQFTDAGS